MADDCDQGEGWHVPVRPFAWAGLTLPLALLLLLAGGGWAYRLWLKPVTAAQPHPFPRPGLQYSLLPPPHEIHADVRAEPDRQATAAMADIARRGLPDWPGSTTEGDKR